MKKDSTSTHGHSFAEIALAFLIILFIGLYAKWYFCDREKEIENRQLQEMKSYHQSQGRNIILFE